MKHILLSFSLAGLTAFPADAANLSKTYSYFTVGGTTLDQLESQLASRGPKVKSTGRRHPGATQMEFSTKLSYAQSNGYCRVDKATVSVKAKVILPRWGQRGKAAEDVRVIWDTLSSDIKRHEESHVVIAKNHARELEQALHGAAPAEDLRRRRREGQGNDFERFWRSTTGRRNSSTASRASISNAE